MIRYFSALALATLCGCGSVQRPPDVYRADVKAMLDAQNEPIRVCYESVLKKTPDAAGTVTIGFSIVGGDVNANNPSKLKNKGIIDGATTAPKELAECVMTQLQGLTLDPSDKVWSDIIWTWEFSSKRVQLVAGAKQ